MPEPIPLLFIDTSPTPTRGGAQKSLLFILNCIDKTIFKPYVVMFVPHDIENELEILDIPFFIIEPNQKSHPSYTKSSPPEPKNYLGNWRDLAYRIKALFTIEWKRFHYISTLINRVQPKLIYLNGNYTAAHGAILASKRFRLPLIAHQRRLSVYTLLDRFFARWIDCMIMYTQKYKEYLHELGVNPKMQTVIYNAVSMNDIHQLTDEQIEYYKHDLKLHESIPVICHIGTVHPIKGQDITLQAILKIWSTLSPFYLLYIGEERNIDYLQSLKSMIAGSAAEPYIHFLGNRQDVLSILQVCDISLEATQAEAGFSRVVIESMCMGKTIVAPKSGCSEIIQDGINGFLYQDNNIDDCAQAIGRALSSNVMQINNAAKNTALQFFDSDAVIHKIEDTILMTISNY